MFTIYICNAGKTAKLTAGKFLNDAVEKFNPDHVVILTSNDVFFDLSKSIQKHYKFPISFCILKNPYSGTDDYISTLYNILEHICDILKKVNPNEEIRLVINGSGGTTKFSYILNDLSTIINFIIPTEFYWGTYDPYEKEVLFTKKPILNMSVFENILSVIKNKSISKYDKNSDLSSGHKYRYDGNITNNEDNDKTWNPQIKKNSLQNMWINNFE